MITLLNTFIHHEGSTYINTYIHTYNTARLKRKKRKKEKSKINISYLPAVAIL